MNSLEHLLLSDLQESDGFGEILSQEPVGIFVLFPLPRMAEVSEAALGVESLGNGLIVMVLVRTTCW